MLYLLMAVLSSAMVSILMRMSEKYVRGNMVMFCTNYAACMVISLIYMGGTRFLVFEAGIEITVILGAVTGFCIWRRLFFCKKISTITVLFSQV